MLSFYSKFLLFFTVIISSCAQNPATIIDRTDFFYNKANSYRYSKSYKDYGKIENGYIEVIKGDTLYGIANYYNISAADIVKANNLEKPYNLKIGSRLKVPQNGYHRVRSGETLFTISKKYNVKLSYLAKINNLSKPYNLKLDQILQIGQNIKNSYKLEPEKTYKRSVKKPSFISRLKNKLDNNFAWPVDGKVVSKFGPKKGGLYNDGINIKAVSGAPVKAAEEGVVAYVGNELRGYGNLIIIKHDKGWITVYAHLLKSQVGKGQEIYKGQEIGAVGQSGNVTFPQLYFGLRKGREALDPEKYLSHIK
jgi:murein DD-endopeptidase MepM/ murein hydrolase activator NlpD